MDISNAFKKEVFKAVVITLIPGAFALAPFIIFFYIKSSKLSTIIDGNLLGASLVYIFISIAIGMVLEDIGARIEFLFGCIVLKKEADYMNNWDTYLRTHFQNRQVGEGYINSVVMRMKFELSFSVALIVMEIGIMLLNTTSQGFWNGLFIKASLITLALSAYLAWEAYESVKLLGKLRKNLLSGVNTISSS